MGLSTGWFQMSSSLYKTKLPYLQHSVAIDSTLLYPLFPHFLNYVVSSLKAGAPFYICLPHRDKSLEKCSLLPLPDFLVVRVCCIHQAIIPQCYETSRPHLIPKTRRKYLWSYFEGLHAICGRNSWTLNGCAPLHFPAFPHQLHRGHMMTNFEGWIVSRNDICHTSTITIKSQLPFSILLFSHHSDMRW